MPITALQRERLKRSLDDHEAALRSRDAPPSPMRATIHSILLELGRNEDLLTLVGDFVDSPDLTDELRDKGTSVLAARGITLPDGVAMQVLDGDGERPTSTLRFEFTVRNITILVDWDPELGASTRARAPYE